MVNLLDVLALSRGTDSSDVFFSHLKKKAVETFTPLTGFFELTPRCTLDCAMCYVHLEPSQMVRPELSTSEWIALTDQAIESGMLEVGLTGGECMIHPGFRAICEHLYRRGVIVSLLTNGTLIDEETVEWMSRYSFENVQVSVYGSSPEGYQAVTGHADAFKKVDHALTLLKEAKIRFTTPITISRQLAPDLLQIVKYCKDKGSLSVRVSANPFPARPETQRNPDGYCLSLDDEVELFRQYYNESGIPLTSCSLDDVSLTKTISGFSKGFLCNAGRSSFSITWDGWMLPCSTIYWMKTDAKGGGFQAAWKAINASVEEFRYPVECYNCKLRGGCITCPIPHYDNNLQEIRINRELCAETERLVMEGFRTYKRFG